MEILDSLRYSFFIIIDPATNNLANSLLFGKPDILDGGWLWVDSFGSFFKPPLDLFHFLFHGLKLFGALKLQGVELFFGLFESILARSILFDIGEFEGEFLDSIWEFKGHLLFYDIITMKRKKGEAEMRQEAIDKASQLISLLQK